MNALVIAPAFNSGGAHPSDATSVFIPGARAFAVHHGQPPPQLFDNHPTQMKLRLHQVLDHIDHFVGKMDVFAAFSHGTHTGTQWGLSLSTVQEVARALRYVAAPELKVILYACSTGEDTYEATHPGVHDNAPGAGDGGIADALRDALNELGCAATVVAHATVGHAFHNPYVREFVPGSDNGGEWLIGPHDPSWSKWVHAMQHSDLWLRMPFLTHEEIVKELG